MQACTGRKVPAGGLPADVGCLVMNIASVSFLASYMKTGMPPVSYTHLDVYKRQLKNLYDNLPASWIVYQEFMFADAATFLAYNANMRGLVVDKLTGCELVVFNRFTRDMDKMAFHKIVRGVSRRPDIAYEYVSGCLLYTSSCV